MRKHIPLILFALAWTLLVFAAGWLSSTRLAPRAVNGSPASNTAQSAIFNEAWSKVRESYVGAVPTDTVRDYGAIRGALSTLNDRFTLFVEPRARSAERDSMRGRFGGIGVNLAFNAKNEIVMNPSADSPAERAGVKAGNILIAIEDIPVTSKPTFEDVITKIRGEEGTVVHITVRRGEETLDFAIRRAVIEVPSVESRLMQTNTKTAIAYIAIHQFTERTGDEVKQAIVKLRTAGANAYILDLRDNGGGLLTSAISVASQFIDDGNVLIEKKRDSEVTHAVIRGGLATSSSEPLVVLVNGNTASASEIVAGAIQDRARGKLIGEKTYGKGSVQLLYDLSDGSSVHVTAAKWLTPNRRTIDGVGLMPDEVIARGTGSDDPQLQRAMQLLVGN